MSLQICKKLAGAGSGTAEWCTNVGNELNQVLTSVLTCEESVEKLQPMAQGLMERYSRAGESPPELMYVDRGCCRVHGISSIENLFSDWVDSGMVIRLDIFHWIHRFDAALRSDHHAKYALFKSALSAAVFAYNKDDMALLVKAIRAGSATKYSTLSDGEVIARCVSKDDLKHFVRRVTVGAHETYTRVQSAIDTLKGPAGLDENGLSLFKDNAAVDEVWAAQQKHLECIQDPPGMNMYTITKHVTRNAVSIPYYTTVRGSNSLEGFHRFLPNMIPGPRCAAVPFQVYLLAGIARWNSDRESAAVKGKQGRKNLVYVSPLISRLNKRCKELFDEVEEPNFRVPMPVGEEQIGLEFLFSQSSGTFNATDHYAETRKTLQTGDDGDKDDEVTDGVEEVEADDIDTDDGYNSDSEVVPLDVTMNLTNQNVTAERDPCIEDVCGPNHLPGYQHVENLSSILVNIGIEDGKLALTSEQRKGVIDAWNKLDLHDRNIEQFDSLYSSRWGNSLFGHTKGEPSTASLVQKLKFGKRHAPAHLVDSRKNRLMYCIIKQLWLHPSTSSGAGVSPRKRQITTIYQRMAQRVTVDDPVLSKLGIPLLKINSKCVAEFIRRQEALSGKNVTDQGLSILRRCESIASCDQSPALELPDVRPVTSNRPQTEYPDVPNLAGTRGLKVRRDHFSAAVPSSPHTSMLPSLSSSIPPTMSSLSKQTPTSAILSPSLSSSSPQGPTPTSSSVLSMPVTIVLKPASTVPSSQQLCARSTMYRKRQHSTERGSAKMTKVNIYKCKLCGLPIQGHHKYKKKTYCHTTKRSPSLPNQVFSDFQDFKDKVDELT